MKKVLWIVLWCMFFRGTAFAVEPAVADYATLTDWTVACFHKLPEYTGSPSLIIETTAQCDKKTWRGRLSETYKTTLNSSLFETMMKQFINESKRRLENKNNWINQEAPDSSLFNETITHDNEFEHAYIQRLIVPAYSKICFMGDYHGSAHSLLRNLWRLVIQGYLNNNFEIIKPNFYIIFLGDFVDRGRYGAEVWYTLMKLKLANWDKVHLLRGNHETNSCSTRYGFLGWEVRNKSIKQLGEVATKFEDDKYSKEWESDQQGIIGKKILHLYHFLPFALYLSAGTSNEYVQCCHGGIATNQPLAEDFEVVDGSSYFFDAKSFIENTGGEIFQKISKDQEGFQWSDFSQYYGQTLKKDGYWDEHKNITVMFNKGRGAGVDALVEAGEKYLSNNNLKAFFRGHQDQSFGFKIFFNSAKDQSTYRADNKKFIAGSYPRGPYHWKYIVPEQQQEKEDGFLLKDYKSIFTFTSASEGQGVPYDCFGMVEVGNGKYDQWRLKVNETSLGLDFSNRNGAYVTICSKASDLEIKKKASSAQSSGLIVVGHDFPLPVKKKPEEEEKDDVLVDEDKLFKIRWSQKQCGEATLREYCKGLLPPMTEKTLGQKIADLKPELQVEQVRQEYARQIIARCTLPQYESLKNLAWNIGSMSQNRTGRITQLSTWWFNGVPKTSENQEWASQEVKAINLLKQQLDKYENLVKDFEKEDARWGKSSIKCEEYKKYPDDKMYKKALDIENKIMNTSKERYDNILMLAGYVNGRLQSGTNETDQELALQKKIALNKQQIEALEHDKQPILQQMKKEIDEKLALADLGQALKALKAKLATLAGQLSALAVKH